MQSRCQYQYMDTQSVSLYFNKDEIDFNIKKYLYMLMALHKTAVTPVR